MTVSLAVVGSGFRIGCYCIPLEGENWFAGDALLENANTGLGGSSTFSVEAAGM